MAQHSKRPPRRKYTETRLVYNFGTQATTRVIAKRGNSRWAERDTFFVLDDLLVYNHEPKKEPEGRQARLRLHFRGHHSSPFDPVEECLEAFVRGNETRTIVSRTQPGSHIFDVDFVLPSGTPFTSCAMQMVERLLRHLGVHRPESRVFDFQTEETTYFFRKKNGDPEGSWISLDAWMKEAYEESVAG